MMQATYTTSSKSRKMRTIRSLNRNRIGDKKTDKTIKAMGMSACQGLCITYGLHSKRFCK